MLISKYNLIGDRLIMGQVIYALYSIGLVLSIICFIMSVIQKPSAEQKLTMLIAVFAMIICFGYWANLKSDSLGEAVLYNKIIYIAVICAYYVIILLFERYYRIALPIWLHSVILLLSAVVVVATATYDMQTLYYRSISFDNSGVIPTIVKEYGPLHVSYLILLFGCTVLVCFISISQMLKKRTANKKTEILMLLVALFPSAAYLIEKIFNPVLQLIPLGMLLTDMILIYLITRAKICDINSVAKDYILDSIQDAFVVVDNNGYYKGANYAAEVLFPELKTVIPNRLLSSSSAELADILANEDKTDAESMKFITKNKLIYKLDIRTVANSSDASRILCFTDVTLLKKHDELQKNYRKDLEREVNRKTAQLKQLQKKMLYGFAEIVENKNMITGNHIKRTSSYARAIAEELRKDGYCANVITNTFISRLQVIAPLHDIGKVSVPDGILDKPGKLTPEEFEVVKTHTTNGKAMIERVLSPEEDSAYFDMAKNIAYYHHEKWNGDGYPEKLAGDNIPLEARIMAVADVFDALVSARPYKEAYDMDKAFNIITDESGKQFDPNIVNAFVQIRTKIETIHHRLAE